MYSSEDWERLFAGLDAVIRYGSQCVHYAQHDPALREIEEILYRIMPECERLAQLVAAFELMDPGPYANETEALPNRPTCDILLEVAHCADSLIKYGAVLQSRISPEHSRDLHYGLRDAARHLVFLLRAARESGLYARETE
jgi:hypothetical protein